MRIQLLHQKQHVLKAMKLHLQKIQLLIALIIKKQDSQSKESQSDTVSNEDAASHSKPSSTHSKNNRSSHTKDEDTYHTHYLYLT